MKRRNYNRVSSKVKQIFLLFTIITIVLFITLLRNRPAGSGPVFAYNRLSAPAEKQHLAFFFSPADRSSPAGLHENNPLQSGAGIVFLLKKAGRPAWPGTGSCRVEGGQVSRGTDRPLYDYDWLDKLLDKIWSVESSRELAPPDGDGGEAIGPLQIHADVLKDVNGKYGTKFTVVDLRNLETAKTIAHLYISMWMDKHKEEIAARIFNGGPRGWQKKSTDEYWEDIRKAK